MDSVSVKPTKIFGEIKFAEVLGDTSNIKKVYWGTAPTGQIHVGYLVPLLLICQLLDADLEVTILLADLHAMLDNMKSTPALIGPVVVIMNRL